MIVDVVENPRHKRRKLSRKQIAAGFGGKRRSRRRSRRRNPSLAVLSGNPRRRRYARKVHSRRRYSRRRNPFGMKSLNFRPAIMVGAGMLGTEVVPMLVRKVYSGLPTAGFGLYAVKIGSALVTATAVKFVTKKQEDFNMVFAGGMAIVLVDLFRQYVAPQIGLAGLSAGAPVYANELTDVYPMAGYIEERSMAGYVNTGMGGYISAKANPVGAY